MLQLARVESGSEILHVEELELGDLAGDVVDAFRAVAENRGVQLMQQGAATLAAC